MKKFENAVALLGALLVVACASRTATVKDQWVYVAGAQPGIGKASAPQYGGLVSIQNQPSTGCVESKTLDQNFGHPCDAHASEGGAAQPSSGPPTPMTDDVPMGNNPTQGEPRWYCDRHTVVRVVLERCGTTESFRVLQIAVAIDTE